eukprot:SAG22_NODE_5058_length_1098_cov_5.965966_1_plen_50_part_10
MGSWEGRQKRAVAHTVCYTIVSPPSSAAGSARITNYKMHCDRILPSIFKI